jgi:hypothetical protein
MHVLLEHGRTTLVFAMQLLHSWHHDPELAEHMHVKAPMFEHIRFAVINALARTARARASGAAPALLGLGMPVRLVNTISASALPGEIVRLLFLVSDWHRRGPNLQRRWLRLEWPRLCAEHLGYRPPPLQDVQDRLQRWHDRARAARAAAPARVVSLLHHSALLLQRRLCRNADLAALVFHLAAPSFFADHHVDPAAREPLPCC